MKAQLLFKKVWGIVSGGDKEPDEDSEDLRDWEKDQQQAAGMIFLALEEGQKTHIQDLMEDPKAMWDALEAVHIQKCSST